jgi:hypothetical protein
MAIQKFLALTFKISMNRYLFLSLTCVGISCDDANGFQDPLNLQMESHIFHNNDEALIGRTRRHG